MDCIYCDFGGHTGHDTIVYASVFVKTDVIDQIEDRKKTLIQQALDWGVELRREELHAHDILRATEEWRNTELDKRMHILSFC